MRQILRFLIEAGRQACLSRAFALPLLGFLAMAILPSRALATANYVYHERTTNDVTGGAGTSCTGSVRYLETLTVTSNQSVTLRFKVEYQFYTTHLRVYYTTDGSAPAGAFGAASGTSLAVAGSYACLFTNGANVIDVCAAVIPAQPAGTTVKYILSAWHSGGGPEIFANSGEFSNPFTSSAQATVFQYTVATPPSVTAQPVSLTVTQGSAATFSLTAAGDAPLFYQWRRNGTDILDATNASFTIATATPANAGNYDAVVTNAVGSVTSTVATLTVLVPPSITAQPVSLTVTQGSAATFSLTAAGDAPLFYQWRRNGSDILDATNASLTIAAATPANAGNYDAVVTNAVGSVTSTVATLTVLIPPSITAQPVSLTVTQGSAATFSLTAAGDAPIFYQWRHNGSDILDATNASLTIASAAPANAGNYDAVVTNAVGSITSIVATLTVLVPASITAQPVSLTVTQGSAATFSLTAAGDAPLFYQWRRNGTDIPDATNASFTIATATPANAGNYDAVVTNAVGSVTSTVTTLTVLVPPSITAQPVSLTVTQGSAATFSLTAAGDAPLFYQWRRNGTDIPDATNASYTLAAAAPVNAGNYDAVVTNAVGSVTSTVATLTVLVRPSITAQPVSLTVTQGSAATFSLTAAGDAPIFYQWRHNGSDILDATNASLTIASAAPANAGNYDAVVTNAVGSVTSIVATLTVLVPPSITAQPVSLTVTQGSAATFSLTAAGDAPLFYQWRRNGSDILDATNASLTIASAAPANAGNYDAVVTNAVGSVTSTVATLTVLIPPSITAQPVSLTVTQGSAATFSLTAAGDAPIFYQWRRNGTDIPDATNASFTIATATPVNAGNYDAVVTNAVGSVTSIVATLTVLVPPAITAQPVSLTVTQGSAATFSLTAAGDAPLFYQWRRNGTDIPDATNASYTLAAATPVNAGNYDAVMTNAVGSVTSIVATLTVLVPPSITAQPVSLTVTQGSAATFSLTAAGDAPLFYQWRRNGTDIPDATNASFTIAAATPVNAGNYDAVVTNAVGSLTSTVATLTVLVPPSITAQPVSLTVTQGSAATFSLTAAGDAPLFYQWRRNGADIPDATNASFTLAAATPVNAGNYDAVVTNAVGSVTSTVATLTVLGPPSITAQPVSLTVTQGSAATFSLTAAGDAPLFYQWRRNGTDIPDATNANYTLAASTPANAGNYDAVVTNAVGSLTSTVATLTVLVPPSITAQPVSLTVTQGSAATFSLTAAGDAPLFYQWRRNGADIPDATNASLTLAAAAPVNAGNYDAVVTNAVGSVTSTVATLTVLVPPSITAQPVSLTVTQGSTATFVVEAIGTAPLSYQWRRAGTNIPGATSFALFVLSAQPADSGPYDVVVVNGAGAVTSTVAVLEVLVPPSILAQPQSSTVVQGQTATFEVAAAGSAPLHHQWRRGTVPLAGATNSNLTLTNATASDGGDYTVVVMNAAGSVTSVVATLTVLVPPSITTQPVSLTVTQGSGATFSLTAAGDAPLFYQWRRNGTDLQDATNASFTIAAATPAHAGNYDAIVTNAFGSITSSVATLTVVVPPSLTAQPVSLTVTQGSAAAFSLTAAGDAPLFYQWRRNGTGIPDATNASYFLAAASPANAGNYDAVVTNAVGSVTSAVATLTVLVPPSITAHPVSLTVTQGSAATFSLAAAGDAPLFYQWRRNGTDIPAATNASLTLAAATPAHAGNYDAVVANAVGSVTSSVATLTVLVPPSITAQPVSLTVTQGNAAAFSLAAAGDAPLFHQWRRNGAAIPDATNASFTLAAATPANAGNYDAVVTNAVGSVTSTVATLTVLAPVVITAQPLSLTVTQGSAATFSVTATGEAPLVYQWRHNGTAIANATNASLTLAGTTAANAGNYEVVVANAINSVTSLVATLTVLVPPSIVEPPAKRVVFQGDNHTFSVTAAGTAPLGYQWRREGAPLAGETNAVLVLTNIQPAAAGHYAVVASNAVGVVTSTPALLTVRGPDDPRYPAPQGGWAYLYEGTAASNDFANALDGTWNRLNGLDSWDGEGRGAGAGLPGGVATSGGRLTLEDAIASGTVGADNRRYYFTHDLGLESGRVTNANTVLSDGVTLIFRARLTPPTDPLVEITNAPNGWVNANDGKGMFGLRQSGGNGLLISFSLHNAVEDTATNTTFNFGQAGLHMNNSNGNARTSFVDPGEPGSLNVLPLDPSAFHEFWITIQDNGAEPGTHNVTIYRDGSRTGAVFRVTAGSGSDQPFTNYLSLGLGSTPQRGAVDVDFFGYAPGVIPPTAFNEPVGFTSQPTNVVLALGEFTTFNVGVTGTPPHRFQWYRNGSPIAGATNAGYTTPPMTAGEDGAQFTVVVTNECNAITSAPPAILFLLQPPQITTQPQSTIATNGDAVTFSVGVNSQAPQSYQWRFLGAPIGGATTATLNLPPVSPASAGAYDVVITNAGGATTSLVAVLTVRVLDLGDAPAPYPVLRGGAGAHHVVVAGVHLGSGIDFELNGLPHPTAAGDDLDGTDDEDGVLFSGPLRIGQVVGVTVTASTNGLLDAWVDFNQDGSWAQPGEQAFTNLALVAGPNLLSFRIPAGAAAGASFGRFRFSTAGGLASTGPAADGEVEDLAVTLEPAADLALHLAATPEPVALGSNLTWTITVSNAGPSGATALLLTNVLPAGATFLNATASQGSCSQVAGRVECNLGALAAGATTLVSVVVSPTASGPLTNQATIAASEFDPVPANNAAQIVSTALGPPIITAQPQPVTITNGSPATFSVTAVGAAPLHYQWRRDDVNIPGATNDTLTLASAQPADAGLYSVRISNTVGTTTSDAASLTVLVPPAIVASPVSQTNLAGGAVSFMVTASGSAPLTYFWYFNTSTLLGGQTNATLLLTNVQPAQAGAYHVVASNRAGVAVSAAAQLTLIAMDFGSAPDPSYPTLLASDGARHRLAPGVRLGALADFEPDRRANAADDDGVRFLDPVLVEQVVRLEVVASTNGQLDAWLDFDRNGSWGAAGEQIFTNLTLNAGTNALTFRVPLEASAGLSHARFRFSTAGNLATTGEAADGEVEDYAVPIGAAVNISLAGSVTPNPVTTGTNVLFTLHLTNGGPSLAGAVTLTHALPAGLVFASATPSQGECVHSNGLVTCSLGVLASNAHAMVTITATTTLAGSWTNAISATTAEADLQPADNQLALIVRAFDFPAILTPPAPTTVTNGDPVTLSVTATGTALTYQWRHQGIDVPNATNAAFILTATSTADAGLYAVLVANEIGAVTSAPVQLTVLVPATVVTHPQNVSAVAGASVTFTVTVTGTAPLFLQWQRNGLDLPGETNTSLTLTGVQPADAGLYRVLVANALRAVFSDNAQLSVFVPPAITSSPLNRTNFAGSDAVLSVTASGTEPLAYQWSRTGVGALAGQTNATLILTNVQSAASGGYEVVVTNFGGAATSAVATLTVVEADFGDAPESLGYPTRIIFNGAWHGLVPGMRLGAAADFEPDGQPGPMAGGDDATGVADEDGVTFLTPLLLGQTCMVQVVVSGGGFIDAWIDFNASGGWFDPGEQILASAAVAAGTNVLSFVVPPEASLSGTFARFRFSSAGGLSFDGPAADGEVEDYAVTVLPALDLALSLVDTPDPSPATSNVVFSLVVTNRGPSPTIAVWLTNTLPAGAQFVTATASQGACSNQSGRILCALGPLAPGQAALVDVQASFARAGTYVTTARVSASGLDVNPANDVATQTTAVITPDNPFLNPAPLPVTDATPSGPGLAVPYPSTITVSGLTGLVHRIRVTLHNAVHTFPGDLDLLLVGPQGQSCLLMSDAGGGVALSDVTFVLDDASTVPLPGSGLIFNQAYHPTDYEPGVDTFPAPAPAGPYGSALSVFAGTVPNGVWSLYAVDDTPNDNGQFAGGWQLDISTVDPIADVSLAVTGPPSPAGITTNLQYSVLVSNAGPAAVSGIRFTNVLPAGAQFIAASLPGGSCSHSAGIVLCELANLAPGAAIIAGITAQPLAPGVHSNHVSGAGSDVDLVPGNNSAAVLTTVLPVNDLTLVVTASTNRVVLGQSFTLTADVTNRSATPAVDALLVHGLPAGMNLISAIASQGACVQVGQEIQCHLGALPTGVPATVQFLLQPTLPALATNTLSLSSPEIDSSATDNAATVVTPVNVKADLGLAFISAPTPAPAGSNQIHTLSVTNHGPSTAAGIAVTLQLPATVTLLAATSSQGSCTHDQGTARCVLDSLPAGQAATVNVTLVAPAPVSFTNHASLTADSLDFTPADDDASAIVLVLAPPSITTQPQSLTVLNGATVAFSVTATGDAPLQYQWRRNGTDLPGATNAALTLAGVTPAQQGDYTVRLQNPVGILISSNATLRVLVPPVISGPAAQTIAEDVPTAILPVTVGDFETPASALVLTAFSSNPALVPSGGILLAGTASNRTVRIVPATNQFGSATITLVVNDADNLAATNLFLLTVTPVNDAPILGLLTNQSMVEDIPLALPVSLMDPESAPEALTVQLGSSLTNLIPLSGLTLVGTGSNRVLNIVPVANRFGASTLFIRVSDPEGATVSNSFQVLVFPVNDPPTLDPIANLSLDEDSAPVVVPLTGLGSGAFNESQTLTVTAASDNPALIPTPIVQYTNGQTTGSVRFAVQPEASGSAQITVQIADSGASNNVTLRTFTVTVNAINDPPTLDNLADQMTDEDTSVSLSLLLGDIDSLPNTLILSASGSDTNLLPPSSFTFSGTGTSRSLTILPATNRYGSAIVTVTVADTLGGSATDSFLLTVHPINDPPTLAPIADIEVPENGGSQLVVLTGISSGPLDAPQPLTLTALSGSLGIIPHPSILHTPGNSTASLTFQPVPGITGLVSITVTIDDSGPGDHQTTRTFTVNVVPVDYPPFLSALADVSTAEDQPVSVPFSLFDTETPAELLTTTVLSGDTSLVPAAGLSISGTGPVRLLHLQPASNASGTTTITVTVTDTNALTTSRTFTLTVSPVNDAPTLTGPPVAALDEDASAGPLPVQIGDAESAAGTLLLSGRSSNPSLIPDAAITFGGTGSNRTVSLAPTANASGTCTVTLWAQDAQGASNSHAFTVSVAPVNDAPTLDPIAPRTVSEGAGPHTIPLTGIGPGAPDERQALTLAVVSDNPALVPTPAIAYTHLQSTGLLTFSTSPGAHGTAGLTVTVQDGGLSNHTVIRNFTVTVNPVNDPPTLGFLPPVSTPEDTALVVPFTVADDLSPVTALAVSAASSDTNLFPAARLVLGGTGANRTLTLLPATNRSGSATITLTVTDTNNLGTNRSFVITVDPVNDTPVLSDVADRAVNEDTNSVLVPFTVGDPETPAASLVVAASSSNPLLVPDTSLVLGGSGTNRTLTLSPLTNATGTAVITLTVRDAAGLAATDTFTLTVNGLNDPPFVSNVPDHTMTQDGVLGVAFAVGDAETASSNLLVTVGSSNTNLISTPGLVLGGTGPGRTLTLTPAAGRSGSAVITLTVADGSGGTAVDTFTLTVQAVAPEAPFITAPPSSLAVATGSNATFSVIATGTAPLAYQWRFNGTNLAGATNSSFTVFNAQATNAGNYAVVITNIAGAVTSTVATLTVLPPSQPPAIAGLTNAAAINEDTLLTRAFTITDPDTPLFQLVLAATSTNTTLVPVTNIYFDGNGSNRLLIVRPATNAVGTTLLTVTVSDGSAIRTNSFVLTVNAVNDAPTLTPIDDVLVDGSGNPAIQTVNLSGISSGASNETQTLVVTATSASTTVVPNPTVNYATPNSIGSITFDSANNNISGTSLITVNVNDGAGSNNVISRAFTAYYFRGTTPPTITALADQTINEDTVAGPLAFTIGDGTTPAASLVLRAFSSNPDLLPTNNIVFGGSGANRTVTLTPLPNQSGTATVRVAVFDADNAFAATNLTLTVNPVNDLPSITGVAAQIIGENSATAILPFQVTDRESPADRLVLTASSSDPLLVPTSGILLGGNGTNRAVQVRPALNRAGTATITLTVTDLDGGSTGTNFLLTVNGTNDAPLISPVANVSFDEDTPGGPLDVMVDDDLTLAGSLVLSAASTNAALLPVGNITFGGFGSNRTVTLTPQPNQHGQSLITLTVTDGGGLTATRSFVATVRPINDPPTLDPLPDLTLPLGSPRVVSFSGAGPGAPNESQFLVVTAVSSQPGVLPDPAVTYTSPGASGSLTLRPRTPGAATVTVTLSDGGPANPAVVRTFNVTVTGPPTLATIPDQSTDEDTDAAPIQLALGDTETAAASLSITLQSSDTNLLPIANMTLSGPPGTNRTLLLRPATNQFGSCTVTVTVTDADTNAVNRSFAFAVRPVNDAPTLAALPDLALTEDAGEQIVSLTGIGSGAANETQTLLVTASSSRPELIPAPAVTYTSPAGTGTLRFTPVANATGTAVVSVVVFDGQSLQGSVTQSFHVTLTATNDAPVISSVPNLTTPEDTLVAAGFVVSDLETPADSLTLSVTSSDTNLVPLAGIVFGGTNANRVAWITPAPDQSGTATLAITVHDADGGSNTTSFNLTVTPVNDPPILTVLGPQIVDEDTGTGALPFTVGDHETASGLLVVRAASSNPTLLPTNAIVLGGAGSNRTVTLTPVTNLSGVVQVTLFVTDAAGAETSASFTLTVTAVNDAPVLSNLADLVTEENSATAVIPFTIGDTETPAANLNVSATSSNPMLLPLAGIELGGTGANRTLRLLPARNRFGTAIITVTVTDSQGTQTIDTFTLTVLEIADVPAIVADPVSASVAPGATVTFTVSAVGSVPLSYQWTRNGVDIPGATTPTLVLTQVIPAQAGSYRCLVSNVAGSVTSAAAILTVNTDPNITGITRSGTTVQISFYARAGFQYTVQYRNDVQAGPWLNLPSVAGTDGILTVTDPDATVPQRFYRVRQEP